MKFEFEIQGYFSESEGWETVTTEDSRAEAIERLGEYRANDPSHSYRIRRMRVSSS